MENCEDSPLAVQVRLADGMRLPTAQREARRRQEVMNAFLEALRHEMPVA